MAFRAGAVIGEAIFDDRKWQDGTGRLKKSNQSMAKSMFTAQLAFDIFKKTVSAATDAVKTSIKNAISFRETQNKFNVVFGDGNKVLKKANDAYKNLTKNYGLSNKAALELLSSTGDLLTGLGFSQEQALEFSESIQELSVDLASFQNLEGGAEQASEALTKALLGETESAKSLGIVIRQNTKEFRDNVKSLVENQGMTEQQAKAQLILQQAMEQSRLAIGDYARTSMSLANMQRLVGTETENLSTNIGTLFLPIVKSVTQGTLEAVKALNDFIETEENLTKIQDVIAKVAAGFDVFVTILKDIGVSIFKEVKITIGAIAEAFKNLFGETKDGITVFDVLAGLVKGLSIGLTIALKIVKLNIVAFIDFLGVLKEVGKAIALVANPASWKDIPKQLDNIKTSFANLGKNVAENMDDIVQTTIKEFKNFPESAKDNSKRYQEIWEKSNKAVKESFQQSNEEIVESEKDTTIELAGEGEKRLEDRKKVLNEWNGLQKATTKDVVADVRLQRDEFNKAGVDMAESNKWANKEIRKAWADQATATLNTVSSLAGQVAGQYTAIFDTVMGFQEQELEELKAHNDAQIEEMETSKEERLEKFDEETEANLERIAMELEQGLISEAEAEEQRKELEERRATEKAALEKELDDKIAAQKKQNRAKENEREKKIFEANKANKIADIWIQAALGIMGAWAQSIAQLGPIAGSIFAGIMTAAILGVAIAQTVLVSQQKFIPSRQEGGMAAGMTRVNEAGGEIITLPDGSQVIPNDISRQIAADKNGNIINMNISFRGAQISNEMNLKRITDHVSMELGRKLELAL
jgi:hypothetical protein